MADVTLERWRQDLRAVAARTAMLGAWVRHPRFARAGAHVRTDALMELHRLQDALLFLKAQQAIYMADGTAWQQSLAWVKADREEAAVRVLEVLSRSVARRRAEKLREYWQRLRSIRAQLPMTAEVTGYKPVLPRRKAR